MLVFWRGWGILVPIISLAVLALGQFLTDSVFGKGTYTANSAFIAPIYGLIAAGCIWGLGRKLNQRDSPNTTSALNAAHSFMFIRMEYWAFAVIAFIIIGVGIKIAG